MNEWMNELIINPIEERETWGTSVPYDSSNIGMKTWEWQSQAFQLNYMTYQVDVTTIYSPKKKYY